MRLDPMLVRQQIENLRVLFPELAEDEEAWTLAIESETNLIELLKQTADKMREAAAMAGAIEERMIDLQDRQRRYERREKAMRWLAKVLLVTADLRKCELPEVTFSIRAVPPSVLITDEAALPDAACKFERKPDKAKLKELLKTGHVAGAVMTNGSETLSVRVK